jgi:predicted dehydrogenase
MKRVIESGEAGSVSMAEAVFGNDRGLEIKPGDWRADPAETPGGPLTQLGIHQINNLQYLLGPVRRTVALGRASVTRWRRVESAGRRFSPASTSRGDVDFAAFIAHEAELGGITLESGHAEVSDGLDPEEP